MLKVFLRAGGAIPLPLPIQNKYYDSSLEFQQDVVIKDFKKGRIVALTAEDDGEEVLKLADGGVEGEIPIGILEENAFGDDYADAGAMLSRNVAVLMGVGNVIATDEVVEDTIKLGTPLYVGTGDNVGLFTSTQPTDADGNPIGQIVGVALSSNNTADKTLVIKLMI